MVPAWLNDIAIASIVLAFVSAGYLAVMQALHPQKMWIMNIVWPVTALYFGPVAIWGYATMGRQSAKDRQDPERMREREALAARESDPRRKAEIATGKRFWKITAEGVTHCGSGCTLGDIIAEFAIFGIFGAALSGTAKLLADFGADYVAAYVLGIVFQYFTIAPMRGISGAKGIWAAMKADTLSLTAFEVGLFGWMALTHYVFFKPELSVGTWTYWFMMQIGMVIGYFTAYPMNGWLIRRGIKEAM